jgi:hypothetical protein
MQLLKRTKEFGEEKKRGKPVLGFRTSSCSYKWHSAATGSPDELTVMHKMLPALVHKYA